MTDWNETIQQNIDSFTGHNGGPPLDDSRVADPTPFDAAKSEIDDLFDEAKIWLDGTEITSEDEADAVDTLLSMARKARTSADGARKVENEPFDTGKAEVQARYNPILKRADMIADGCKARLTPWRNKVLREKEAKAEDMRKAAAAELEAATAAIRESAGDIEAREAAEKKLRFAKDAGKTAGRYEKAATTNTGVRTVWRVEIEDREKALDWAFGRDPDAFLALAQSLAETDVRAGRHVIPGFTVIETKVAI